MTARILIVEDEPFVALEIEHILRSAGFEIASSVPSVEKALAALNTCDCDLAVLDANLRGESAEPVGLALRKRGKPFLFVSGYGRSYLPVCFNDSPLLSKPFNAAELIQSVKHVLQSSPSGHRSAADVRS
jgi:DNA-binding response OmpR family regulator